MIYVKFTGNYEKYLSNLPGHTRRLLNAQSNKIAYEVRKTATPYVPKKSGKLRSSMRRTKTEGTNKVIVEVEYEAKNPKTGFKYSYIQEHKQYKNYTTPGTGPRYLRKGMSMSIGKTKRIYINAMNEAVRSA